MGQDLELCRIDLNIDKFEKFDNEVLGGGFVANIIPLLLFISFLITDCTLESANTVRRNDPPMSSPLQSPRPVNSL